MKKPRDDGRCASHGVDDIADHLGERVLVVHQVGSGEHTQGDGEEKAMTDLLDRPHDGGARSHRSDWRVRRQTRHVGDEKVRKPGEHH